MGVGEQGAAGGETIEVRRVNSFASPHAVDPVVEVVHRDEKHVGPMRRLGGMARQVKAKRYRQGKQASERTGGVGIHGMRIGEDLS